MSTRFRPPDQIIQPYDFGEDASKRTCLWLKDLPPLKPTKRIPPRYVCPSCKGEFREADGFKVGKNPRCPSCPQPSKLLPRWSNQTSSGQNKLPPSERRAIDRSKTYLGIAKAMAEAWG